MKHFKILLFLLLGMSLFAQEEMPRSYEKALRKQERKMERYQKKYFATIPAEELVPLPVQYDAMPKNWGVDYVKVKETLQQIKAKPNKRHVVVYVFDTAGEYDNTSLQGVAVKGRSYTGEPLKDGNGHSAHCAGVIGSKLDNIGISQALISQNLLTIYPVKMLHNRGFGKISEIRKATREILELSREDIKRGHAVVWSNSWGSTQSDNVLNALYKEAYEAGILITASSGNNGGSKIGFPASSPHVLSVGAQEENGQRAGYSQYGQNLDVVAPGSRIYSLYKNNSFATLNGTSMSNPHTAAACALLLSYYPNSTNKQVTTHIKKYSTDIYPDGKDKYTGNGSTILTRLFKYPLSDEDNGDDDDDGTNEPITREYRDITLCFDDLKLVWGIGSFQDQRKVSLSLRIQVETKYQADYLYDEIKRSTDDFFGNRGIMFVNPNRDFKDAQEWAWIFFERFAEAQQDFDLALKESIIIDDQGRELHMKGEDIKQNTFDFAKMPFLVQLQ